MSTMMEVVVASGIVGVVAAAALGIASSTIKFDADMAQRMSAYDLKTLVNMNIDCAETLYRACEKHDNRLWGAKAPLAFDGFPYKGDRRFNWDPQLRRDDLLPAPSRFLSVACANGAVHVSISSLREVGEPLFEGGVCKRRFKKAFTCPEGQIIKAVDALKGAVTCAPAPR